MEGLGSARRVRPDENINGVLCRHYTFDEKGVSWEGISRVQGEMWIAVEGDYVVKFTMEADGENPFSKEDGHIEWVYDVRDVNTVGSDTFPAARPRHSATRARAAVLGAEPTRLDSGRHLHRLLVLFRPLGARGGSGGPLVRGERGSGSGTETRRALKTDVPPADTPGDGAGAEERAWTSASST